MAYLLDANVFIQAKNLHYGMDFCPAFWDWLIANNQQQKVYSIEKVGDEIEAGNDQLAKWADQRSLAFFLKPDSAMLSALGKVSAWATDQGYDPAAVNTFFQVADYYLVAFCGCPQTHHCDPRNRVLFYEKNQNSQRLHRSWG